MTEASELHVVIGGSGGTGAAIVRQLAAREKRVRAISRCGSAERLGGVEAMAGDATDPERMREVCRGATVVYNCVNPAFAKWTEVFPPAMEAIIEGAARNDAKLVFADDTWMYGKVNGPMTEGLPVRPVSNKGVLRAWLAEMLMRAHDAGRVRATIGRAGELYGPGVKSVLGDNLVGKALKGMKARWIGDLDMPVTPTFIEDFAAGLVTLGERDEALGEAWHVPTAKPTTGREFTAMIFEEAGKEPKISSVGSRGAQALGIFWSLAREVAEMVYQFERPFVVDWSKYQKAFGGGATPYREGIRQTVEWHRREIAHTTGKAGRSIRQST